MTPQLVSCIFGSDAYERMGRVLRYTAGLYCPDWHIRVEKVAPALIDPRDGQRLESALGKASHLANTQKMIAWDAAVQAAPDGAEILLIDCDAMVVGPLDEVWTIPFDLAITTKRHTRFPFNSGVVFVRVNARTRAFFRAWRDENLVMLRDRDHHQVWRRGYGGINQAALGRALESGWAQGLHVHELPCAEWNCEDSHWREFDPAVTRIVHVKSALRMAILGFGPTLEYLRPLVLLWRRMEQAA